jgi:hypothetical protein
MAREIFRKQALERLSSPEQLDQLMRLTSPRGWLVLAGAGVLLLAALGWGLFGRVAFTVTGRGCLVRPGGFKQVAAPRRGVVGAVRLRPGDEVVPDQELLRLAPRGPDDSEGTPVRSPYHARVLEVAVREGDGVAAGDLLVLLDPVDEPLQAALYVSTEDAYRIEHGMPVQVWPASEKKGEYGCLRGQVVSAARFPSTLAAMGRRLGNDDLTDRLVRDKCYMEVLVELASDPATPTHYRWSSSQGPPGPLYAGTPCDAVITVGEHSPLRLVFPGLRDARGP